MVNGTAETVERNLRVWKNSTNYVEVKYVRFEGTWSLVFTLCLDSNSSDAVEETLGDAPEDTQIFVNVAYTQLQIKVGDGTGDFVTNWTRTLDTPWNITAVTVGGSTDSWSAGTSYLAVFTTVAIQTRSLFNQYVPLIIVMVLLSSVLGGLTKIKTRR
jgi:hypothetical protein